MIHKCAIYPLLYSCMLSVLHPSLNTCAGRWWAPTWILPIVLAGRWKERENSRYFSSIFLLGPAFWTTGIYEDTLLLSSSIFFFLSLAKLFDNHIPSAPEVVIMSCYLECLFLILFLNLPFIQSLYLNHPGKILFPKSPRLM